MLPGSDLLSFPSAGIMGGASCQLQLLLRILGKLYFESTGRPTADFVACFPKGTSTEVCSTVLTAMLLPSYSASPSRTSLLAGTSKHWLSRFKTFSQAVLVLMVTITLISSNTDQYITTLCPPYIPAPRLLGRGAYGGSAKAMSGDPDSGI
jgi:hypothetical protein